MSTEDPKSLLKHIGELLTALTECQIDRATYSKQVRELEFAINRHEHQARLRRLAARVQAIIQAQEHESSQQAPEFGPQMLDSDVDDYNPFMSP